MNFSADNKENIRPHPTFSECKDGISAKAKRIDVIMYICVFHFFITFISSLKHPDSKRKGFNRLLSEATNQIRDEADEKAAFEAQNDEAYEVILQWFREENDSKMAAQLARTLEDEAQRQESLAVALDKEEALKLAIDERIRIKEEQRKREELEKLDFEFAKKFFAEEEIRLANSQKLCEEDEIFVRELHRQFQSNVWQDLSTESKEVGIRKEKEIFSQEHSDFEQARQLQRELDTTNGLEKTRQEIHDFRKARRMMIKTAREDHQRIRRAKAVQQLSKYGSDCTFSLSQSAAAVLWERADAEVENVCGGICITILLPNIKKLKVSRNKAKLVRIEAARFVEKSDKYADGYNSQYVADFKIQGRDVELRDSDLSYDYFSDVGLLHVYIENVSLDGPSEKSPEKPRSSIIRSFQSGYAKIFRK